MALLDLQGMTAPELNVADFGGSSGSGLSVLICH